MKFNSHPDPTPTLGSNCLLLELTVTSPSTCQLSQTQLCCLPVMWPQTSPSASSSASLVFRFFVCVMGARCWTMLSLRPFPPGGPVSLHQGAATDSLTPHPSPGSGALKSQEACPSDNSIKVSRGNPGPAKGPQLVLIQVVLEVQF